MSVDLNRYNTRIREILGLADLDTTSAKAVRRQLEVEYSVDLTEHKQEVDKRILQILNEIDLSNQSGGGGIAQGANDGIAAAAVVLKQEVKQDVASDVKFTGMPVAPPNRPAPVKRKKAAESAANARKKIKSDDIVNSSDDDDIFGSDSGGDGGTAGDEALARKLQREEQSASRRPSRRGTTTASTAKSSKSTTKRAAPKNSPFTRPLVLSPALSALMGETHLARFEVVKRMWAIIKDRGLQDPADGRYIRIMDEDMRQIFGKTKARVQMFSMNKVLSKHMMKPEEVVGHDLPFEGVVEQIDDEEVGEDPPKRAAATRKAAPKRKRVAETNADGTPKKRKNNPLDQLQILSPILSSILKKPECSRPQVVKGIWDYIKERDLQDPANRKFILCDGPLQELFGTDRVSGFGMNSILSKHLTKKPKSEIPATDDIASSEPDSSSSPLKQDTPDDLPEVKNEEEDDEDESEWSGNEFLDDDDDVKKDEAK